MEDIQRLGHFNQSMHGQPGREEFLDWTEDLTGGSHPTMSLDHVHLVLNDSDELIATACSIPQRWRLGGRVIAVERIELVATHPAYRGSGLAGRLLGVIEEDAQKRGVELLAITGLKEYYLRFGYEYALQFGQAALPKRYDRLTRTGLIEEPRPQEISELTELVTPEDLPDQVSVVRDSSELAWELFGQRSTSQVSLVYRVLRDASGKATILVGHKPAAIQDELWVGVLVTGAEVSDSDWVSLMSYLDDFGRSVGASKTVFRLWTDTPQSVRERLEPSGDGDAWYLKALDQGTFREIVLGRASRRPGLGAPPETRRSIENASHRDLLTLTFGYPAAYDDQQLDLLSDIPVANLVWPLG